MRSAEKSGTSNANQPWAADVVRGNTASSEIGLTCALGGLSPRQLAAESSRKGVRPEAESSDKTTGKRLRESISDGVEQNHKEQQVSNLTSLKTMAESKAEGVQKATYFKVDPLKVEFEDGFNLRDEGPELDAHLESMYQAMKAGAAFPPIDVSIIDGKIIASDGHCRTRTARRLIAEGVPYTLEARQFRGNEAERVCHMLGSAQGKSLTPLEAGRGFVRLIRYGLTVADICKRLGVSRPTVDNGLALAEAPVAVHKMLAAGEVSVQVVHEAIAKHGEKAATVLQEVVAKAQASGVKKVTKKHVSAPKISQAVAQEAVNQQGALLRALSKLTEAVEDRDLGETDPLAICAKESRQVISDAVEGKLR